MPLYNFVHNQTGEEITVWLSMSELDGWKEQNPEYSQVFSKMSIGDPHRMGRKKPADSFRGLLKSIHKKVPGSKIQVP